MRGTAAAASGLSRSVAAATAVIGMGREPVARGRAAGFVASPSGASSRRTMAGRTTLAISVSIVPGGALGFYP